MYSYSNRNNALSIQDGSEGLSTLRIQIENTIWGYENLLTPSQCRKCDGFEKIIVDLSLVQRMNMAGFAQLISLKRRLLQEGRQLEIRGMQNQPMELCRLLKLEHQLITSCV